MKTTILVTFLVATVSAFSPASSHSARRTLSLFSEEPKPEAAASTPEEAKPTEEVKLGESKPPAPKSTENKQAEYGKSLELPSTYVRCGGCQSHFALTEADLGERGKGRRLECSVCGNTWFQSKERIMGLRDGMELVELPDNDKERIKLNKEEGKPVGFVGDSKLYVGNVAFECTPTDMYAEFAAMGTVGDVAMVYDNETGRPRGFAFVTMRNKEGADKALAELNGKDIMGRQISVREANN